MDDRKIQIQKSLKKFKKTLAFPEKMC